MPEEVDLKNANEVCENVCEGERLVKKRRLMKRSRIVRYSVLTLLDFYYPTSFPYYAFSLH